MLKQSDLMALCRLVAIEAGNNRYANIVEPSSGFIGEIVASGFLNDLLIRNVSCFNSKESIEAVIKKINDFGSTCAALRATPYDSAAGALAYVYGIEFDNSTVLWLTRYAEVPSTVMNLSNQPVAKVSGTTQSEFVSPMAVRSVLLSTPEERTDTTEPTEVDDLTWFEKIGELNGDHKAWLLVQLNAAFTRIDRKDLFAEFLEAIDSK